MLEEDRLEFHLLYTSGVCLLLRFLICNITLSPFSLHCSRPHLLNSLRLFDAVAMPRHEPAVPKFGEWDGNEDLSYSIVFDNARADKERFMPGLKNLIMDSSLNQENYKNLHNRAQYITGRRNIETEVKGSRLENPNLSSKHVNQGVNTQKASQSVPEFDKKFSDGRPIMGSSILSVVHQQPVQRIQSKDLLAQDMVVHGEGSHFHAPVDGSHKSAHRAPGSLGQAHQNYSGGTIAGSHGRSEASTAADLENVAVPKFGDWDLNDVKAGEDFSIIFDKARSAKPKKAAGIVSLTQPSVNIYNDSQPHKKKRGWLNILCLR